MQRYKGYIPIEMFGRNLFPRFGELPYLLTLGPINFTGSDYAAFDGAGLVPAHVISVGVYTERYVHTLCV